MGTEVVQLVDIEPQELKFVFELRKQSSCSVQLSNKSDEYVAFKVKTTSPKRYCVRPNAGIILPKSTVDFTVTLQAQKAFPADMQCRDKFLVQNIIVPTGTRDTDLTSETFSKEPGKHIQEIKLRVVFISPLHSSVLKPLNGVPKQEHSEACLPNEPSAPEEATATTEVTSSGNSYVLQELPSFKETTVIKENISIIEETISSGEMPKNQVQESDEVEKIQPLHASMDLEKLNSKVKYLESQLAEAEKMNALLRDQKSAMAQDREKMYHEMAILRTKHAPKVQVGFPLMFVCFIGLVGIVVGNLLHR